MTYPTKLHKNNSTQWQMVEETMQCHRGDNVLMVVNDIGDKVIVVVSDRGDNIIVVVNNREDTVIVVVKDRGYTVQCHCGGQ